MWLCISFPVTGSKFNMLHGLRIKVKSSWLNMDTRHEIFALYNSWAGRRRNLITHVINTVVSDITDISASKHDFLSIITLYYHGEYKHLAVVYIGILGNVMELNVGNVKEHMNLSIASLPFPSVQTS